MTFSNGSSENDKIGDQNINSVKDYDGNNEVKIDKNIIEDENEGENKKNIAEGLDFTINANNKDNLNDSDKDLIVDNYDLNLKNSNLSNNEENNNNNLNNSNSKKSDSFSTFRRENDDTEFEKTLNDIEQEMAYKNYNESKTIEKMQRELEIKEEWQSICNKLNISDDEQSNTFRSQLIL